MFEYVAFEFIFKLNNRSCYLRELVYYLHWKSITYLRRYALIKAMHSVPFCVILLRLKFAAPKSFLTLEYFNIFTFLHILAIFK